MAVLAVIPARGGSKGVLRKNVRLLCGKPLISWTIEAAMRVSLIDQIIVSTEDEEIAQIANSYGNLAPFKRPQELAEDLSPTLPVVQHVVYEIEKAGKTVDVIVLLQPTTPLRLSSDIELGLIKLKKTECDSVVSVVDVGGFHPYRMKKLMEGERLVNFVDQGHEDMRPRQELPPIYIREGSIYIAKRDMVMNQNSLVGGDVRGLVISPHRSVNIDTMFDFERAERLLSNRIQEQVRNE